MSTLQQHLLDHLEALTGERHRLVPEKASALPLFLRARYEIRSVHLFGRRFLLALETDGQDVASPGEYEAHAATLRAHLAEAPVLVLHALPSYARNRMVRLGLPFIVPGNQVFLPTALMDLREHFPQPKPTQGKPFTPAAQCLVLYHLQRKPLEGLPLKEIARMIGYSPIMLTKVKNELEAAQVCSAVRQGKSVVLRFTAQGKALWEKAKPFLSSPVRKTHWVQWQKDKHSALAAGLTALARRTLINDDVLPTCALSNDAFRANLERGLFRVCQGPEEAAARLECWAYDPELFGENGAVDPLSLYLALREMPDERIQQQLETLIDQIQW